MPRSVLHHSLTLALGSAIILVATAPAASAGQAGTRSYDLPAQPLAVSLRSVALASGRSIIAPAQLVRARRATALKGTYTVEEALAALLAGSGLHARANGPTLVVEPDAATPAPGPEAETSADILVTGSRIRGAPVASPVITVTRDDARNAGQATLGEIVRSIPQSFGGGQNPGIGFNVPSINGVDVGGGSSINLRGLGSDATLTLLNGHRVA